MLDVRQLYRAVHFTSNALCVDLGLIGQLQFLKEDTQFLARRHCNSGPQMAAQLCLRRQRMAESSCISGIGKDADWIDNFSVLRALRPPVETPHGFLDQSSTLEMAVGH